MVKALFDTNILIDFLNGIPQARTELSRYEKKAMSIVSWMEVMVGAEPDVEAATRGFLSGFDLIGVDEAIAERAVELRRQHRVRLPDAIIWASAETHAMLLVTRDVRHIPEEAPGVRVPYRL
ncbi:MAG: type II toxin-antitoxin system VapC family toxin [Aliihoeflea sp.]|jgi:predicted nucleic acid-binding protein